MSAPIWTAGETLLALQLADVLEWQNPNSSMPPVIALSRLLSRGSFHPGATLPGDFRNPNSVKMKVSNLIWYYTDGQRGLSGGAAQDLSMVQLYRTNPSLVLKLANELRRETERSQSQGGSAP